MLIAAEAGKRAQCLLLILRKNAVSHSGDDLGKWIHSVAYGGAILDPRCLSAVFILHRKRPHKGQ